MGQEKEYYLVQSSLAVDCAQFRVTQWPNSSTSPLYRYVDQVFLEHQVHSISMYQVGPHPNDELS